MCLYGCRGGWVLCPLQDNTASSRVEDNELVDNMKIQMVVFELGLLQTTGSMQHLSCSILSKPATRSAE